MKLPQGEAREGCHFSALLELENGTADDLRLEILTPDGDAWATLLPLLPAGSVWRRRAPLYLPRVKAVRLVRTADGLEVWRRAPWGEGGAVSVR